MRLVILGGSRSGKSTQAQRLCKYYDVPLISAGDILRKAIKSPTDFSQCIYPYVETGEPFADRTMIEFIQSRLKKPDCKGGWVLEGYPQTALQAEELDFVLHDLQQKLDWAIYLQVPEAVMVSRFDGCYLPDDQPEIVQRRVELFYDRTIPILEYYDRRRCLLTINGDQPPEVVQQSIITLLSIE